MKIFCLVLNFHRRNKDLTLLFLWSTLNITLRYVYSSLITRESSQISKYIYLGIKFETIHWGKEVKFCFLQWNSTILSKYLHQVHGIIRTFQLFLNLSQTYSEYIQSKRNSFWFTSSVLYERFQYKLFVF